MDDDAEKLSAESGGGDGDGSPDSSFILCSQLMSQPEVLAFSLSSH